MTPHLALVAELCRDIPIQLCHLVKSFRAELTRRLRLRAWHIQHQVKLIREDTYLCGALDLLAYPPLPPAAADDEQTLDFVTLSVPRNTSAGMSHISVEVCPPILIQIERAQISYRTRAKLQSWGTRPCSGKLVVQLYALDPDPIPEADLVIARGAYRKKIPQGLLHRQADLRRLSRALTRAQKASHARRRQAKLSTGLDDTPA